MKPDDVLARIVSALENANIPYMLRGSLASSIYGTPRATNDIVVTTAEDSIVSKLDWAKLSGSEIQLRDVAGILRARSDLLDASYIQHWVRELQLETQWEAARRLE